MAKSSSGWFDSVTSIADLRSASGLRFEFKYFFTFIVMAVLSGANSTRKIESYLRENRKTLNSLFDDLHWHESPSRSQISRFVNRILPEDLEKILPLNRQKISQSETVHMDGKSVRGEGLSVLNVFCERTRQVIGQEFFAEGCEIAALQSKLSSMRFKSGTWITADAIHCQKKPSKSQNAKSCV